jgi:SAM-dependent methyltransferase
MQSLALLLLLFTYYIVLLNCFVNGFITSEQIIVRQSSSTQTYAFIDGSINRRSFICQVVSVSSAALMPSFPAQAQEDKFHSAGYGIEEYTNSIVASRDTNISPKEVYDTIASDYLKEVYNTAIKERGNNNNTPLRALDVGCGAGVSTEVLFDLGFTEIDSIDWSGEAWRKYVVEDPDGHCPQSVHFYELDDERYLEQWRERHEGLFDVITFNFAVNESKAIQFAKELLKDQGRLLAPINTSRDYWLKQNYIVMNSNGDVLSSESDVGAWSVQFQPDVTSDTCSGVWCAPYNGFKKKQ